MNESTLCKEGLSAMTVTLEIEMAKKTENKNAAVADRRPARNSRYY